MRQRVILGLATLLVAVGLAACGSTNYGSGGASSSPPSGAY